ncbi:hypothetical protein B9G98_03304 [Wickerhamiella sorbophila]|uniref:non-specific serine/threonine protein kinase n=1 Tax=Wickerhamiella sorbophila TaxID=45607 RepID=A0A2T0FL16_9ASCO|nr:hypothetical protein B9G98_03304 [Wickerhamiella sorbophila]PRT55684.1 hypothetical protein B9G98_03304 [Wickerhamiella sorbophila]
MGPEARALPYPLSNRARISKFLQMANWQQPGFSNEALNKMYSEVQQELSQTGPPKRVGNYEIMRKVGEGAYSKVYLALHVITRHQVVLKDTIKDQVNLAGEIVHLRTFRHPHIARLYEIIVQSDRVWLVMEYCAGEELYLNLARHGPFNIVVARRMFTQLVGAVAYAHMQQCAHRDLKLENVLLDNELNIKLGDFGFTRSYQSKSMLDTVCGTEPYMAPELLLQKRYNPEAADVWSLGIIFYAILFGKLPFDEDNAAETRNRIINCEPDMSGPAPDDLKDLIKKMLCKDSRQRPRCADLLRSECFGADGEIQMNLLSRPAPQPFQSRQEREILKAMRALGMDLSVVAESINQMKCDPIHGIFYTALDKAMLGESRLTRRHSESSSLRHVARAARAILPRRSSEREREPSIVQAQPDLSARPRLDTAVSAPQSQREVEPQRESESAKGRLRRLLHSMIPRGENRYLNVPALAAHQEVSPASSQPSETQTPLQSEVSVLVTETLPGGRGRAMSQMSQLSALSALSSTSKDTLDQLNFRTSSIPHESEKYVARLSPVPNKLKRRLFPQVEPLKEE